jgi:hypothetical protein
VIVAVPAETPVTTPELLFTVATAVLSELQEPPAVPLLVKVVVPPTQIACVPANVPALGGAVTVTTNDAVAFEHPPEPATVYVIVAVPAVTPLIAPVELFTVAIAVLSELQEPPAVPSLVNVVVPPTQIACVPLNIPAIGAAVTVTVRVAVTFEHPPVPVTVYVIVAVPAVTPLIAPVELFTVAIAVLSELQEPPATVELNAVLPPIQIP